MRKILNFTLIMLVATISMFCSKDLSDDIPSTYTTLSGEIENGWTDYINSDYVKFRDN